MATALLDMLTTLSMTERQGTVTRMTRVARVTGLTETDPQILTAALATSGVPAKNTTPTGYPNLILLERNAALVPDQRTVVDVMLEYGAKADDEFNFVFRGAAGLNQISTQVDRFDVPLFVSHTFPADDPDFPSTTKTQGGDVQVSNPMYELVGTGVIATDYPHFEAVKWINKINSRSWAGAPPGMWLCTNVSHVPFDAGTSPKQHQFTFNFQANPYLWNPPAFYVDPRTGKPPPNLVAGTGIVTVDWYTGLDYNQRFPLSASVL